MTADTAAAALAVLVEELPPADRDRVAADLVDALRYAYASTNAALPEWLRKLRE